MVKAAIVGSGVIGSGWAARFLMNGWDVAVFDPDPDSQRKTGEVLENARRALPALYNKALPPEGRLSFHADLGEAVSGADWVQESGPEQLALKHAIHRDLSRLSPPDAVIASSTSGFKPSALASAGARVIAAHPFNPVYLLPLVELVGDGPTCARAAEHLRSVGMFPLTLRKEIDAHVADRLLEAVWREALWLIRDGICTTEELDEAIRMGFGLRWAQMGLFETYRIAGGEAGMRHFLAQFGPALKWPWTRLTDVPELDETLVDLISDQSDAQSGHLSIRALERQRDDSLVAILRALRRSESGAGKVIAAHEATLPEASPATPPVTVRRQIPQTWADYNGHMNEAAYLEAASEASDRFMALVGCDAAYIAGGGSYFTLESHVQYLAELRAGEMITITTQLLSGKGKTLHLFHCLNGPDGATAATIETLLIHVDLRTRRSAPPSERVTALIAKTAMAHAALPFPEAAGRGISARSRSSVADA
ncbi:MAG: carnitine 3-dehydrogenase [Pseudomonadota bacterium]